MKDRPTGLSGRLQQLSSDRVHVEPRSISSIIEIAARPPGNPSTVARNDWTFHSNVESIICHYREIWQFIDIGGKECRLHNLHFHLLQYSGPNDPTEELLAFHWHPTATTSDALGHHSHRPHLHFSVAPDPLPKAHLGVTLGVATSDQVTVPYLDAWLDEAVRMVATEVLGSYV